MANVNSSMQTLTAQWYNTLVSSLQLNQQQFQLYQAPGGLASSQNMWNVFDSVPSDTLNNYYDQSPRNSFAGNYSAILLSLMQGNNSNLQNCMGDYYHQWMLYLNANIPNPFNVSTVSDLFNMWAMMYAPSQARCVTTLTKGFTPTAFAEFFLRQAAGNYPYNQTINTLQQALDGANGSTFTLDTATASSDTSTAWTQSILPNTDFFSVSANPANDALTLQLLAGSLNVNVSFNKFTTFTAQPFSQSNNNPNLMQYRPWYISEVLQLAYQTQDNTVWNSRGQVNWDKAFGPSGFLRFFTYALVVADGINVTISSTVSFSSADQTAIKTATAQGIWPLYLPSGQNGVTNNAEFNSDGQITCTINIPTGNPQIIGLMQQPTANRWG